ncbi:MAG: alcohol dehydrogenase catalytic domain-containing protein [Desulfobulbaceae bacterium]|nr:alcohol dehydrogenase catalytic domain-containing protein [Desulfobulbaceae bacterium]
MRAVVFDRDVGLVFKEVEKPTLEPGMVLVRTVYTGFCGSDKGYIVGKKAQNGYILGHETSGIVEDFGSEVSGVDRGTRVIIRHTFCNNCHECRLGRPHQCAIHRRGIGVRDMPGAFAEYFIVYPQMLITIPPKVDMQNAALAEVMASALHGFLNAKVHSGAALVMGGGPIGLSLVRILRLYGFDLIVLSEPVKEKRALGIHYGADVVVNPLSESLGVASYTANVNKGFDVVYECSGFEENINTAVELVRCGGTVCVVSVINSDIKVSPRNIGFKEVYITGSNSNTHAENKQCLRWMESGLVDLRPLITDIVSLEELPTAFEKRILTGKAIKLMVRVSQEPQ